MRILCWITHRHKWSVDVNIYWCMRCKKSITKVLAHYDRNLVTSGILDDINISGKKEE